jgi:hypothetical protein
MDPITLIVTALMAGAAAGALDGLSDDAKDKAKAAYAKLHLLVRRRLAADPVAQRVLAEYESDPQVFQAPLVKKLTDSGADEDPGLVAEAKAVLDLVDAQGTRSGKYNVSVHGSQGVQIGSYNRQVNFFGSPPSRESSER